MNFFKSTKGKFVSLLFLLFIWFLISQKFSPYILGFLTTTLMYIGIAQAWNVIGLTGKISFGHAAFFGIGSYITVILYLRYGIHNLLILFIISGLVSGLFAVIVGYPFLRLRGPYFAIGTLGLANVVYILAIAFKNLTNGASGISIPISSFVSKSPLVYYNVILGIVYLQILLYILLLNSKMGIALKTIRDDEEAALAVGVNTTFYKVIAFGISAFLTGVIGSFYALYITYINPMTVFSSSISLGAVAMSIFGGIGTVEGPIIGGIILLSVSEVFRSYMTNISLLVYGATMIIAMLFFPKGIIGVIDKMRKKGRRNHESVND